MSDERRSHARIEANLGCALATSDATYEGRVANLSLGGAAVLAPPGVAEVGGSIGLCIEGEDTAPLLLNGEVVRIENRGEERLYCLRFTMIAPPDREVLTELLTRLARGRGLGARRHPRVQHRLDVTCRSAEEFRATLRDISQGGLALQCEQPLKLGTEVMAVMGLEDFRSLLELRGTVVHVQELVPGTYRVGIRFDHMPKERERQLSSLIDLLLGLGPRQGVVEDDDGEE